jgi:mono/diheme cytochrome c family protein
MRLTTNLFAAVALVWAFACTGDFEFKNGGGGGVNPPPAGNPDAGSSTGDGAAYFQLNVLPMLSSPRPKGACALCHQGANTADGPDFLGLNAETNYATLLATPGLIGIAASSSSLYTRGDHGGNAFLADELIKVSLWIDMEQ